MMYLPQNNLSQQSIELVSILQQVQKPLMQLAKMPNGLCGCYILRSRKRTRLCSSAIDKLQNGNIER